MLRHAIEILFDNIMRFCAANEVQLLILDFIHRVKLEPEKLAET